MNPRIKQQCRRNKLKLEDKIISIVQASRAKNKNGYRTSCVITIPRTISKLAGIKPGSLVSWELSKYEHNVFVIRPVVEPETEAGANA